MFLFKILDEIILSITSAKENSVGEDTKPFCVIQHISTSIPGTLW